MLPGALRVLHCTYQGAAAFLGDRLICSGLIPHLVMPHCHQDPARSAQQKGTGQWIPTNGRLLSSQREVENGAGGQEQSEKQKIN